MTNQLNKTVFVISTAGRNLLLIMEFKNQISRFARNDRLVKIQYSYNQKGDPL